MKFFFNGKTYRIFFNHEGFSDENDNWVWELTLCRIVELDAEGRADRGNEVACGIAHRHPSDNFSKEIGRKISLERALYNATSFVDSIFGGPLTGASNDSRRTFRAVAWETYFAR